MNINITLDLDTAHAVMTAIRNRIDKLNEWLAVADEYDRPKLTEEYDSLWKALNDIWGEYIARTDKPMPEWTMTIREFIKQDIDIDVWDDEIDDGVAFVGPCRLTAEGRKEYADILDLPITFGEASGTAPHKAMDLFWSFAGFTGVTRYNRLFEDKV